LVIEREVLVVGGGPTGSVVATLLAQWGRDVLLIGDGGREGGLPIETVVPSAADTLERLGLQDALGSCASPGPLRHGRCWSNPTLELQDVHQDERGWRFRRPDLDLWLRDRARHTGVEVIEGARARGTLCPSGGGEVLFEQNGESLVVDARLIIAATGRSSGPPLLPVATRHRLPEMIALSAIVDCGDTDEDASVIEAVAEGWIWWLPFGDGRASVALFCDPSEVRARGREEVWKSALNQSQGAARGIDATPTRGTLATARIHQSDGGLLIAGDAISAIDPLSSQGLEKALVSAEETALAAQTTLLEDADLETMVDQRQRWEMRLFRLHRHQAVALYHAETRFGEHPFWAARHQLDADSIQVATRPTGRLTPAAELTEEPRWIRTGNRLAPRPGIRLSHSDEESIDQVGQVPTGVLLDLIGDELPMRELQQRAAGIPALIDQSPASLAQILGEMCRLELLIEN